MTLTRLTIAITDDELQAEVFASCEDWGLEPAFDEETSQLYFECELGDRADVYNEIRQISENCPVQFADMIIESTVEA